VTAMVAVLWAVCTVAAGVALTAVLVGIAWSLSDRPRYKRGA